MKRLLVIINLSLLIAVVLLGAMLSAERSSKRRLDRALAAANARAREAEAAAENTNELHEVCRARIDELTRSFNTAADQLIAMSMQVKELEARAKVADGLPVVLPPASSPGGGSVDRTPSPVAGTSLATGPRWFGTLYGTNRQVLGTNLVFSGVYGRRVAFKDAGSTRRVAFDVDQLDPGVLADLGIDAEAQKALHLRQEKAWQQVEATSLTLALAEEQRRRDEKAAREEAARKQAEEMQNQAAANAANGAAQPNPANDNSGAQPQNGYPVPPYQYVPPVSPWAPPWWWRPRPW